MESYFSDIAFSFANAAHIECFVVFDNIPGRSDIIYVCIRLLSLVVTGPVKRPRLYSNGHITAKMIGLIPNIC